MKTAKQIKEEKIQSYLKSNQLNINLIKKLDKLPNGEIVIAVYAGKDSKIVTDFNEYKVNQIFINNEFVSYIEFSIYSHQDFKDLKKEFNLKNSDVAEILGLTVDSVKTLTQPNKELPTWAKAMIYVWKKQRE